MSTTTRRSTGRILGNADGSMANWGDIKREAADKLGLLLVDSDVDNIPLLAADPYGNFTPGPNGLPQYVTATGLVEGNLGSPVAIPANAFHIDTAFLNDIAHSAVPNGSPDPDSVAGTSLEPAICANGFPSGVDPDLQIRDPRVRSRAQSCYDNELLDLHVIAGDGRANENIGLTTIHTIFEHEHNRLRVDEQNTLDPRQLDVQGAVRGDQLCVRFATNNPEPSDHVHLRPAHVPSCPIRDRDGVPTPGVRGVRPQDPAGDQPVQPVRLQLDGHQPGASRPNSPTPSTASATRCSTRPSHASTSMDHQRHRPARRVPEPGRVQGRHRR